MHIYQSKGRERERERERESERERERDEERERKKKQERSTHFVNISVFIHIILKTFIRQLTFSAYFECLKIIKNRMKLKCIGKISKSNKKKISNKETVNKNV